VLGRNSIVRAELLPLSGRSPNPAGSWPFFSLRERGRISLPSRITHHSMVIIERHPRSNKQMLDEVALRRHSPEWEGKGREAPLVLAIDLAPRAIHCSKIGLGHLHLRPAVLARAYRAMFPTGISSARTLPLWRKLGCEVSISPTRACSQRWTRVCVTELTLTGDLVCLIRVEIIGVFEKVIGVPMITVLLPASRTDEVC
jgi:hypothetical protein